MTELRDRMDREARRVSAKPEALEGVLRRAERRRHGRQAAAAFTALALVAGVTFGGWRILSDRSAPQRPISPTTTPGSDKWPDQAWPDATRADAEAAQQAVDSGDTGQAWRIDAEAVATRYVEKVKGWHDARFDESLDLSGENAVTLYVSSCAWMDTSATEPCDGSSAPGGDAEMMVTLERLVRQDAGGIWDVTATSGPVDLAHMAKFANGRLPDGLDPNECPSAPVAIPNERDVRAAAIDILQHANVDPAADGNAPAVWKYLDPTQQSLLGNAEGLFAYHFAHTALDPKYTQWTIAYQGGDLPGGAGGPLPCGQEVRNATVAVQVIFSGNENDGGTIAGIAMIFVGHPGDVKLWYVQS